jgi:release factor glutamine methyltransferase
VLTIEELLNKAQQELTEAKIDTPRLDAEILLARILEKPRTYLMTWPEREVESEAAQKFQTWMGRRLNCEPVAYILGDQEFYGHLFKVSPAVLIPRPETEHLVEKALDWCRAKELKTPKILDLCTGSGCVGLTVALEIPGAEVTLSELSPEAKSVALQNRDDHGLQGRVQVLEGDLFEPINPGQSFDLILANPPYVEESYLDQMQKDVRDYEPHLALFAPEDGLSLIRRIIAQSPGFLKPGGLLALEIGAGQSGRVNALWGQSWKSSGIIKDLSGHDRTVYAEYIGS